MSSDLRQGMTLPNLEIGFKNDVSFEIIGENGTQTRKRNHVKTASNVLASDAALNKALNAKIFLAYQFFVNSASALAPWCLSRVSCSNGSNRDSGKSSSGHS